MASMTMGTTVAIVLGSNCMVKGSFCGVNQSIYQVHIPIRRWVVNDTVSRYAGFTLSVRVNQQFVTEVMQPDVLRLGQEAV